MRRTVVYMIVAALAVTFAATAVHAQTDQIPQEHRVAVVVDNDVDATIAHMIAAEHGLEILRVDEATIMDGIRLKVAACIIAIGQNADTYVAEHGNGLAILGTSRYETVDMALDVATEPLPC